MNAIAPKQNFEFVLLVINGKDRGTQYKLINQRITLGRGSDNDIVIKEDNKISRNHAIITISPQGIEITDVSGRNKIYVDGNAVTRQVLNNGSLIQLGDTKFQFKAFLPTVSLAPFQENGESSIAPRIDQSPIAPAPKSRKSTHTRGSKKRPVFFYVLVAIIGIVFVFLLTSKSDTKKGKDLRSEEDVTNTIDSSRKIVEDTIAERQRSGKNTRQYEEAQPNYIKGFRDYRKGQFERAIESFQACLALFPEHIQCKRYLNLSQKKFDELIQYHMILANKYRSQNQFSACKASYRNAMVMLRNPNNKTYIEAKAGFDACETLGGDNF